MKTLLIIMGGLVCVATNMGMPSSATTGSLERDSAPVARSECANIPANFGPANWTPNGPAFAAREWVLRWRPIYQPAIAPGGSIFADMDNDGVPEPVTIPPQQGQLFRGVVTVPGVYPTYEDDDTIVIRSGRVPVVQPNGIDQ